MNFQVFRLSLSSFAIELFTVYARIIASLKVHFKKYARDSFQPEICIMNIADCVTVVRSTITRTGLESGLDWSLDWTGLEWNPNSAHNTLPRSSKYASRFLENTLIEHSEY